MRLLRSIVLSLAFASTACLAADYPSRPIRLVVPFGVGTTSDIIARLIGAAITRDLGQNVVIDNRPGAGGTIGGQETARAGADGHTLVLGTIASHGIATVMFPNVRYDPQKDFAPITLIADAPNVMVVHRSLSPRTPAEFLDFAKKSGSLNFTSAGTATTSHLAGELLRLKLGVPLSHVPYKAAGQALTDVLSGQIPVMIWQVPPVRPHVESGALRAVAAMSAKRIATFPNLPTMAETVLPGFDSNAWFGILAPAGTPRAVVDRLHKTILGAMATPEMKQQLAAQGLEASGAGPERFAAVIQSDLVKWREVIQQAGLKAE